MASAEKCVSDNREDGGHCQLTKCNQSAGGGELVRGRYSACHQPLLGLLHSLVMRSTWRVLLEADDNKRTLP